MVRTLKNGFTLIEVMIVVVIIAILASIAYPSYQQYVIRTNRVDTQTQLIDVASKLQRYKIANFTFFKSGTTTPIDLSDIQQTSTLPSPKQLYTLTLTNVTANAWTLTATPINASSQVGDGNIVLNSRGERCWTKGTTCTPTAATNWDGK